MGMTWMTRFWKKEIIKSLFKLKNWRAPGLTGITVEQLNGWYRLAHPEDEKMVDEKAERNWNLIIKIIQKCFEEGNFWMLLNMGF